MGKYSTIEDYIRKAREKHGDKFDYSLVEYVDSVTNVIIICPEHGEFLQKPVNHLRTKGCPKCGGVYKPIKEEFIQKANERHGNRNDYSKVVYVNTRTKVIIICPEHGVFKQTPASHLRGEKCPKCANIQNGINKRNSLNYYIEKANVIHINKYDYSLVEYISNKHKIIILCPIHGQFEQRADKHLSGQGCSMCEGRGFTYKSFEEVKEIIKTFDIKTKGEYIIWWNNNKDFCRENGIPYNPSQYYNKSSQ